MLSSVRLTPAIFSKMGMVQFASFLSKLLRNGNCSNVNRIFRGESEYRGEQTKQIFARAKLLSFPHFFIFSTEFSEDLVE